MKKELYAVVNKNWKEDGWKDWFYEQLLAIRRETIFGMAIFSSRKEAVKYYKISKRKTDKIVKINIII